MDLKLKEVAELLQVSEKTIYRWVKDGKIPCYRINHQYRFIRKDIENWMKPRETSYANPTASSLHTVISETQDDSAASPVSIFNSLLNGGIYYNLTGENMRDTLNNAVRLINIPAEIEREKVLAHLLQREEMASTAFGNGIAFPHPRNPLVSNNENESISICFLNKPLSFGKTKRERERSG